MRMRFFALVVLFVILAVPLHAATLFTDDFTDNNYDGWTYTKPVWSAAGGVLTGQHTRKTDLISSYSGCISCTLEADVQIQSPGGRVALLGWYTSKSRLVEVRLMQDKQKILLRHKGSNGIAAKRTISFPISAGVFYHVKVTYFAGNFELSIDDNVVMTVPTKQVPSGKVGLRVASTKGLLATGVFDNIAVTGPDPATGTNDFLYQLQNNDLIQMGNSAFDLVIMDYSSDGSEALRYTPAEIAALRNSPGGPKIVLAYMSIGEAEDYRWYWQNSWDANHNGIPDAGAPAWLSVSNPDWPGNYEVRYWDPNWQAIIYGSPTSYLDKIMDTGFDGVYLDIVDAFEYWGPGGPSGEDRQTAEQEMVDFVIALANYARTTRGKPAFQVFPQNGEALSSHADYVDAVSGIGKEDTWYDGNSAQPAGYTQDVLTNLDVFLNAGKLVLVTDYCRQQSLIDDFYNKAILRGYVPYATVRDLDQLTINPGHPPD